MLRHYILRLRTSLVYKVLSFITVMDKSSSYRILHSVATKLSTFKRSCNAIIDLKEQNSQIFCQELMIISYTQNVK